MITKIITISAGLIVFSLFVVFGTSFQGEVNAVSSTVSAGGNGTDWDKFLPENVTINAGESVTWTNPMQVSEPHTVTFVKDKEMIPPLVAPFSVPNNT
jgi:plastocyanin